MQHRGKSATIAGLPTANAGSSHHITERFTASVAMPSAAREANARKFSHLSGTSVHTNASSGSAFGAKLVKLLVFAFILLFVGIAVVASFGGDDVVTASNREGDDAADDSSKTLKRKQSLSHRIRSVVLGRSSASKKGEEDAEEEARRVARQKKRAQQVLKELGIAADDEEPVSTIRASRHSEEIGTTRERAAGEQHQTQQQKEADEKQTLAPRDQVLNAVRKEGTVKNDDQKVDGAIKTHVKNGHRDDAEHHTPRDFACHLYPPDPFVEAFMQSPVKGDDEIAAEESLMAARREAAEAAQKKAAEDERLRAHELVKAEKEKRENEEKEAARERENAEMVRKKQQRERENHIDVANGEAVDGNDDAANARDDNDNARDEGPKNKEQFLGNDFADGGGDDDGGGRNDDHNDNGNGNDDNNNNNGKEEYFNDVERQRKLKRRLLQEPLDVQSNAMLIPNPRFKNDRPGEGVDSEGNPALIDYGALKATDITPSEAFKRYIRSHSVFVRLIPTAVPPNPDDKARWDEEEKEREGENGQIRARDNAPIMYAGDQVAGDGKHLLFKPQRVGGNVRPYAAANNFQHQHQPQDNNNDEDGYGRGGGGGGRRRGLLQLNENRHDQNSNKNQHGNRRPAMRFDREIAEKIGKAQLEQQQRRENEEIYQKLRAGEAYDAPPAMQAQNAEDQNGGADRGANDEGRQVVGNNGKKFDINFEPVLIPEAAVDDPKERRKRAMALELASRAANGEYVAQQNAAEGGKREEANRNAPFFAAAAGRGKSRTHYFSPNRLDTTQKTVTRRFTEYDEHGHMISPQRHGSGGGDFHHPLFQPMPTADAEEVRPLVLLVPVNSGYFDFGLNLLCSLEKVDDDMREEFGPILHNASLLGRVLGQSQPSSNGGGAPQIDPQLFGPFGESRNDEKVDRKQGGGDVVKNIDGKDHHPDDDVNRKWAKKRCADCGKKNKVDSEEEAAGNEDGEGAAEHHISDGDARLLEHLLSGLNLKTHPSLFPPSEHAADEKAASDVDERTKFVRDVSLSGVLQKPRKTNTNTLNAVDDANLPATEGGNSTSSDQWRGLLFTSMDTEVHAMLKKLSLPAFHDPQIPFIAKDAAQWGHASFHALVCSKLVPVIRILKSGVDVVFSDADIAFVKPFIPMLRPLSEVSVQFSIGSCHKAIPDNANLLDETLKKFNTGFYYVKSTPQMIHLFERGYNFCSGSILTGDQPALNTMLQEDAMLMKQVKSALMKAIATMDSVHPDVVAAADEMVDSLFPRNKMFGETNNQTDAKLLRWQAQQQRFNSVTSKGSGGADEGKAKDIRLVNAIMNTALTSITSLNWREQESNKNAQGGGGGADPSVQLFFSNITYRYGFFDGCLFANGCTFFKGLCKNNLYDEKYEKETMFRDAVLMQTVRAAVDRMGQSGGGNQDNNNNHQRRRLLHDEHGPPPQRRASSPYNGIDLDGDDEAELLKYAGHLADHSALESYGGTPLHLRDALHRPSPILVHANFLVGKKEKIKHLRKNNVWFDECIADYRRKLAT